MGRKGRIERIGGIYHIIQRGNNREYIFREEIDKGYLIKLIKKYKDIYNYRILGFVLMDNHYHLIIQPLKEELQLIMHRINSNYSKYYNYKYRRSGHVFQGRYKSIVVWEERYLLGLLRYIHQNPVKAKMVSCIEDYKWSSDIFYRTNICNKSVDIDLILNKFSKDRKEAIIDYRKFMDENYLEEANFYEDIMAIGEGKEEKKKNDKEIVKTIKSLEQLLGETGVSEEEWDLIKKGSRKRNLTKYKVAYIQSARDLNYTYKEIAIYINVKPESVYEIIKKYCKQRVVGAVTYTLLNVQTLQVIIFKMV